MPNFLDKMNSTIVLSAPNLAYIAIDQKFLVDPAEIRAATLTVLVAISGLPFFLALAHKSFEVK